MNPDQVLLQRLQQHIGELHVEVIRLGVINDAKDAQIAQQATQIAQLTPKAPDGPVAAQVPQEAVQGAQ